MRPDGVRKSPRLVEKVLPDTAPVFRAEAISTLPGRGRVSCRGYIEAITVRPASAPPSFSAIVTDVDKYAPGRRSRTEDACPEQDTGENRVRLVWMGQRRVPGIEAGTQLRFEGMVSREDGLRTVYNPRYEIISHQEAQP